MLGFSESITASIIYGETMTKYDLIFSTSTLQYSDSGQELSMPEGKNNSFMAIWAGKTVESINVAQAFAESHGYTPLELWGWEQTVAGIISPILGAVGLLSVNFLVISVKGERVAEGIGKQPQYSKNIFQYDIPPPPARYPIRFYELVQTLLNTSAVAGYGLADLPKSWDMRGVPLSKGASIL